MLRSFRYGGTGLPVVDARPVAVLALALQLFAFFTAFPLVALYLALPLLAFMLLGEALHRVAWSARLFLAFMALLVLVRGAEGGIYALRLSAAYFTARLLLHVVPVASIAAAFGWFLRPLGRRTAAGAGLYAGLVLRYVGQFYRSGRQLREGVRARGGSVTRRPARLFAVLGTGLFLEAVRAANASADALYARGYSGVTAPFPPVPPRARMLYAAAFLLAAAPAVLSCLQ